MPDPLTGGLVLGGGGAILNYMGGQQAAESQQAGAESAAAAQLAAIQSQERLAQQAMGVSDLRYNQAYGAMSPYMMGGQSAYNQVLAQLGLPTASPYMGFGSYNQPSAPMPPQYAGAQGGQLDGNIMGIEAPISDGRGGYETNTIRSAMQGGPNEIEIAPSQYYQAAAGASPTGAPQAVRMGGIPGQGVGGMPSQGMIPYTGQQAPAAPVEAMDLSQSPLYQNYLADLREKQRYAFGQGMEQLQQNLATQGLLGSGTALEEITDLSSRAFQAPSASEFMMPHLMNLASSGQAATTNIGSIGQGQAGQVANILGQQGANVGQYGQGMSNLAIQQGNIGAQQAMMPYNALMGGLQMGSQVYGSGAFGGGAGYGGQQQIPYSGIGMGQNFGGYV